MEKSLIIKQLEFYSNAIISFVVLQGLIYCYNFGTNEFFNTTVKSSKDLSVGLFVMLSITMVLGFIANYLIGNKIKSLVEYEYVSLVSKIYSGKLIVIIVFGLLPVIVTYRFGIPS